MLFPCPCNNCDAKENGQNCKLCPELARLVGFSVAEMIEFHKAEEELLGIEANNAYERWLLSIADADDL